MVERKMGFVKRQLRTEIEIADRLQVPPHTLANWRWRGIGPRYARIGKHVRYDEDDVEAWVEDQKRAGGAA